MTALQWLNDLVQWFGRFFPRLTLVPPTHRGVRFGPRGSAQQKGPGLVIWWPLLYQLVLLPVTTQSISVSARCVPLGEPTSRKGLVPRVAICGLSVQYRVVDPVKAALNALNLHALIDNRCQAAIGSSWRDIASAPETVAAAAEAMKPWLLESYGVELERIDVTHLGEGACVLSLRDYGWNDHADGAPRTSAGGAG